MSITLWILGGLVAGLVLVGVTELLKGPHGPLTRDKSWWESDQEKG